MLRHLKKTDKNFLYTLSIGHAKSLMHHDNLLRFGVPHFDIWEKLQREKIFSLQVGKF